MKIIKASAFAFLVAGSFTSSLMAQVDMVKIPSGSYTPLYKDDPEGDQISVDAFYIDTYPVTNAEYREFVAQHPEWQKGSIKGIFADENYLSHWRDGLDFGQEMAGSPVTRVSWFAAKKYCQVQGKRLPTIEEWEYVAAASDTKADAVNDDRFYQQLLDWYSKPNPKVHPDVSKGFRNYYGVYGMHGSIWEWVLDFNSVMLVGESRANAGIDRELFCAGGTLGAKDTKNYIAFLRYAFRSSLKANYTTSNLGFRCAKDVNINQ